MRLPIVKKLFKKISDFIGLENPVYQFGSPIDDQMIWASESKRHGELKHVLEDEDSEFLLEVSSYF